MNTLLSDLVRSIRNRTVEFANDKLVVPGAGVFGGTIRSWGTRHELVQRAMDSQDDDKVVWARGQVLSRKVDPFARFTFAEEVTTNMNPTHARTWACGVMLGALLKKSTWYLSGFSSDSTPVAGWDANWASVPVASEIAAAATTASARLAGTFGAPSNAAIAMSAPVTYTVDTGVTDLALYGGTVNSSSTFG